MLQSYVVVCGLLTNNEIMGINISNSYDFENEENYESQRKTLNIITANEAM